ncbi:MAG: signal peptidase I, partial [Planctomycetaceae bacterium]|nr:signal peptidase I [Planctomycetaceae bacterium]
MSEIDASQVPRNEGDQLLVHKQAYELRPPRRWEVIVFRNPSDPRQAYVKRLVGLPGETLDLVQGDVYVNGELQRKPFSVQQAIRILVSDFNYQPSNDDPDWQPRWVAPGWSGWATVPHR